MAAPLAPLNRIAETLFKRKINFEISNQKNYFCIPKINKQYANY
jgi:hypothetical protein